MENVQYKNGSKNHANMPYNFSSKTAQKIYVKTAANIAYNFSLKQVKKMHENIYKICSKNHRILVKKIHENICKNDSKNHANISYNFNSKIAKNCSKIIQFQFKKLHKKCMNIYI